MHSWIFRNRRRLERLYGLAPARAELGADGLERANRVVDEAQARPGEVARPAGVPEAEPAPRGALPARVLVPMPRRVA